MSTMDQAAEADLLEQQSEIVSTDAFDTDEVAIPRPASGLGEASEGDLLAQEQVVESDEDLYPYGSGEGDFEDGF